ncbi:uncharacterized protein [Aristolochia californica]
MAAHLYLNCDQAHVFDIAMYANHCLLGGQSFFSTAACFLLRNSSLWAMESVVAAVSGYSGVERFNLIKLITQTGAYYVGSMNKSTTHLVCWQFEGRKYDLAKKLGIKIVNHHWFEDCLKEGKRLPEDMYSMQSGQQVGALLWEPSVNAVTSSIENNHSSKMKRKVLNEISNTPNEVEVLEDDNGGWDVGCSNWSVSNLLCESKELAVATRNRRNVVVGGAVRKGRRLVKNSASDIHLNLFSGEFRDFDNVKAGNTSQCKGAKAGNSLSHSGENRNVRLEEVKVSNETDSSHLSNNISNQSLEIGSPAQVTESKNGFCDLEGRKDVAKKPAENFDEMISLPTATELSCVICWTDFSSTRGVLPCGHRFCYSCIQSWADYKASLRKDSLCPLCKASFRSIMKVEDAAFCDQKIYSQTIPGIESGDDIYMVPEREVLCSDAEYSQASVCCQCQNRQPEDLLVSCHLCQIRWVHSFCLDPPLLPWTCIHCKDLRMLYQWYR